MGKASDLEAYKARNYYMVDHADILVAVYDNNRSIRSGTGMTVNYAYKAIRFQLWQSQRNGDIEFLFFRQNKQYSAMLFHRMTHRLQSDAKAGFL